VECCLFIILK